MEPTPASRHWVAPVAIGILAVAVIAAGGYALRNEMLVREAVQQRQFTTATSALATRLDRLEEEMQSLANATPDPAPLQPITQQLGEVDAHTTALAARIEALEHQLAAVPAPVAVQVSTPAAPAPVPPVMVNPTSQPGTAEHMSEFRRIVDSLPPATPADSGTLARINQHLGGLVRIHKTVADPYEPLRHAQDIAAARAAIATLPIAQRAPFAGWLTTLDAADTGAY